MNKRLARIAVSICPRIAFGCIAGMCLVVASARLPGEVMTIAESQLVAGADCGYVEDGGGTDWGCCGPCLLFQTDGTGTYPEFRNTSEDCLEWETNQHCPHCTWYSCLGDESCDS